ncbi:hypothetical protein [Streptomyces sp. NBC_01408]|uniref:hypothetical protein n=1 Tax=Streptomyces sp. NBC_01408 TaxID=2903855 RepID=UPI00224C90B3|nr:hypothetical protein [Streptomyces sp. NBC_01408]MCX4691702.1 hypothetical protein [Streptomyces sp. NBC_01408]
MRIRRESIDLPEDRGCLQWVLGFWLVVVYLPAALLCWLALVVRPQDVRIVAGLSIGLCLFGLLITVLPVFRRTMGRWWYAVPFLLASVAYVRAQTA